MKLVQKFIVKRRFYEENTLKSEIVTEVVSKDLFESDDLLAIGSYLNDVLRLNFDCARLLRARGSLEDNGKVTIGEKMLSDYYCLKDEDDDYYFMIVYSIEN